MFQMCTDYKFWIPIFCCYARFISMLFSVGIRGFCFKLIVNSQNGGAAFAHTHTYSINNN